MNKAKIHDKYVIELEEVIKGYGNDPNQYDPFNLSMYYKFYEIPGAAIQEKYVNKMIPLNDILEHTEGICTTCKRCSDNGGVYDDGRSMCPIENTYALPKNGYCHLYEPVKRLLCGKDMV